MKELNGAGRVYIVTNGTYSVQKSRFDIARLWDYAEEAFVSEKIGFDKPNKAYTDYVVSHIPDFDKSRAYGSATASRRISGLPTLPISSRFG